MWHSSVLSSVHRSSSTVERRTRNQESPGSKQFHSLHYALVHYIKLYKWCHSTMAQTTMAHASMTIPLRRRSSLAHPGMARSGTAQVRCGAVSVWRIPVWRRPSTAHFTMAQFRVGASKHRRKRAVPRVTCRLQTKYSNYTN